MKGRGECAIVSQDVSWRRAAAAERLGPASPSRRVLQACGQRGGGQQGGDGGEGGGEGGRGGGPIAILSGRRADWARPWGTGTRLRPLWRHAKGRRVGAWPPARAGWAGEGSRRGRAAGGGGRGGSGRPRPADVPAARAPRRFDAQRTLKVCGGVGGGVVDRRDVQKRHSAGRQDFSKDESEGARQSEKIGAQHNSVVVFFSSPPGPAHARPSLPPRHTAPVPLASHPSHGHGCHLPPVQRHGRGRGCQRRAALHGQRRAVPGLPASWPSGEWGVSGTAGGGSEGEGRAGGRPPRRRTETSPNPSPPPFPLFPAAPPPQMVGAVRHGGRLCVAPVSGESGGGGGGFVLFSSRSRQMVTPPRAHFLRLPPPLGTPPPARAGARHGRRAVGGSLRRGRGAGW